MTDCPTCHAPAKYESGLLVVIHASDCKQRKKAERLSSLEAVAEAAREARTLVDRQAEDEGLWFVAEGITEAYFQQELRALHVAVERIPLDRVADTPAGKEEG